MHIQFESSQKTMLFSIRYSNSTLIDGEICFLYFLESYNHNDFNYFWLVCL